MGKLPSVEGAVLRSIVLGCFPVSALLRVVEIRSYVQDRASYLSPSSHFCCSCRVFFHHARAQADTVFWWCCFVSGTRTVYSQTSRCRAYAYYLSFLPVITKTRMSWMLTGPVFDSPRRWELESLGDGSEERDAGVVAGREGQTFQEGVSMTS